MAKFKVIFINREGHAEGATILARNRREAWAQAKKQFDDVIKVKRDPLKWSSILGIFAIAVALFVILFVI